MTARKPKRVPWKGWPRIEPRVARVAHAICPIVKPWMDQDTQRHPCRQCNWVDNPHHGPMIPMCMSVMVKIAQAAIEAMPPKRRSRK